MGKNVQLAFLPVLFQNYMPFARKSLYCCGTPNYCNSSHYSIKNMSRVNLRESDYFISNGSAGPWF